MRARVLIALSFCVFFFAGLAQANASSNRAGSLDPSFGQAGKVVSNFYGVPTDVRLQSDGKIDVVGGPGIIRFLANGAPDSSFGQNGAMSVGFATVALAIQPDLKLVLAGSVVNSYGQPIHAAVARLNPDGSIDRTFGSGGVVTLDFASGDSLGNVVALQPDGKILVGGLTRTGGCLRTTYTGLARLNQDGSFDIGFGSGGIVAVLAIYGQAIDALALQSDAKILLLGDGTKVVRFLPNGAQDPSISGGTIASVAHVGTSSFLPSGKVIYASNYYENNGLDLDLQPQRYLRTGNLDTLFHGPIIDFGASTSISDEPYSIALAQSDRLVVVGSSVAQDYSSKVGLARFDANGNLDQTFGSGGRVTTTFMRHAEATAVAIQADGKIVVVGATSGSAPNAKIHVTLARYLGF